MVVATEAFVAAHPDHAGSIAFLITSDEEGPSIDGVRRVAEEFRRRGQRIDWCLVGEPSSQTTLGDLIRVGRRGSLHGQMTVRGVQGHVAYPEKALNPVHASAAALAELAATRWDEGNAEFPRLKHPAGSHRLRAPEAEPRMVASSRHSVPRWSNSGRSTPASTKSMNACHCKILSGCLDCIWALRNGCWRIRR